MAKKHKHEEHENHERWLVSYADFITLLFAFFTVLYALGQTEKREYKDAIISIQRAFLSGGGVFPLKGYPFNPYQAPPDRGTQVPPSPQDVGKHAKADNGSGDGTQDGTGRIMENIRGVYEKTSGLGLEHNAIEVIPTKEGFRIRLSEKVLFSAGSDRIQRKHVPFLYEVGMRLKNLGYQIQIEGHSDSTPTNNRDLSNWELSLSRAYHVVQFLVEAVDYPKDRISLAGFGDTKPISDNTSVQGRSRNRRVEISVITDNRDFNDLPW